jgi:hypothetical protein
MEAGIGYGTMGHTGSNESGHGEEKIAWLSLSTKGGFGNDNDKATSFAIMMLLRSRSKSGVSSSMMSVGRGPGTRDIL